MYDIYAWLRMHTRVPVYLLYAMHSHYDKDQSQREREREREKKKPEKKDMSLQVQLTPALSGALYRVHMICAHTPLLKHVCMLQTLKYMCMWNLCFMYMCMRIARTHILEGVRKHVH
jgi:hypothetical protein